MHKDRVKQRQVEAAGRRMKNFGANVETYIEAKLQKMIDAGKKFDAKLYRANILQEYEVVKSRT